MIRSTLLTFTKQTMGRVRRRTSTKQRSMTLVVRSFLQRCRGKLKNDSSSGRSRSSCRTMLPYWVFSSHAKANLHPLAFYTIDVYVAVGQTLSYKWGSSRLGNGKDEEPKDSCASYPDSKPTAITRRMLRV